MSRPPRSRADRADQASGSSAPSDTTGPRGPPARLQEPAHRTDRRGDRDRRVRAVLGRGPRLLMADDERIHTGGPEAPPAGEAIHLPGPTYLPIITAVGITIAVVGVVQSWVIVG